MRTLPGQPDRSNRRSKVKKSILFKNIRKNSKKFNIFLISFNHFTTSNSKLYDPFSRLENWKIPGIEPKHGIISNVLYFSENKSGTCLLEGCVAVPTFERLKFQIFFQVIFISKMKMKESLKNKV